MRVSDTATAPFAHAAVRSDWPVLVALPAVCAMLVLAVPAVGWWMVLVATVVYAAGFRAFVEAQSADATAQQLLGSLGRISEMNGAVVEGHSRRTAELAHRIGSKLDLGEQQMATVVAAARVHTVGLVGREEPPRIRPGFDHNAVARWTRSIVGSCDSLHEVAQLAGAEGSGVLAAIVDVAATYDEARNGMGMTPAAAFALVSRETPPQEAAVTAALAAVLGEDGVIVSGSALQSGAALAMDTVTE